MQQNAQETSKCKETRKNSGKKHFVLRALLSKKHLENCISLKSLQSIEESFKSLFKTEETVCSLRLNENKNHAA